MKDQITVPVRQMVEMICRTGDLENGGVFSPARAMEGTAAHQKIQKKRPESYKAEVPLKMQTEAEGLKLLVEGRADGIDGDLIEEIKSTYKPKEQLGFSFHAPHRAQLLCYGCMLAQQQQLETVCLKLTYFLMESEEEVSFEETWDRAALKAFFDQTVAEYARWLRFQIDHAASRDASLNAMTFPFPKYRKGQREMAGIVYRTVRDGGGVFLQAPTGIGKTISTLFPSLKAMGGALTDRIFYLTAKNATAMVAVEALEKLEKENPSLDLLSVVITSKEKNCLLPEPQCDPKICPYARGHYDRINEALWIMLHEAAHLGSKEIRAYAGRFSVCPYELALEAAHWSDLIVGDYNYAFDPGARLHVFFDGDDHDYTLLVDEAHNLPDRAREMFSAAISEEELTLMLKLFRGKSNDRRGIRRSLRSMKKRLQTLAASAGAQVRIFGMPDDELVLSATQLVSQLGQFLERAHGQVDQQIQDFYFSALFFLKMQEEFDESSVVDLRSTANGVDYHLDCVHPAAKLRSIYDHVRAIVFFSATFLPMAYYKELLHGGENLFPAYMLPSSFDPSRRLVLSISDIRADYQHRNESVSAVAAALYRTYVARTGHYMAYFPSYAYLEQVRNFFEDAYPDITVWSQQSGMDEEQKAEFLAHFEQQDQPGIAFAVLGGMFSEGIDLRGDRLIGVMIVTVGIPQIGIERDLIRDHMERCCGHGFDWAYLFPGLGKVFQAAGRVIRTEEDRGVIVLIDQRYQEERYARYFPADWNVRFLRSHQITAALEDFWQSVQDADMKLSLKG